MTHPIIKPVTKAAKAAMRAVRKAETPANTIRLAPATLKTGVTVLKQPTFNWKPQVNK